MRKAFDANVTRAKPRLRLGSLVSDVLEVTPEALSTPEREARQMGEHATAQADAMTE